MKQNIIGKTMVVAVAVIGLSVVSCHKNEYEEDFPLFGWDSDGQYFPNGDSQYSPNGDSQYSSDSVEIADYDGQVASDAGKDIVGTDEDFYWEANSFTDEVIVTYAGESATVEKGNDKILYNIDGAYVTIDMLTNSVKNVKITVSGESGDGQLKIYGDKKFMLALSGVDLTCSKGPAINNQCKKRVFVHLEEGSSNYLTDASSYSTEPYYHSSSSEDSEDRKGCFFSEANLIFSGTGILFVEGNNKHGIATDGYFYMRPGVTIVVTDAAKNAIHVKGDSDDGYGIYITGGLIYAATTATAGKCLKTDEDVVITGGEFYLYTSGGSEYDEDEQDTSSPAGIKTNGDIIISGGSIIAQSTGTGGKGLNSDGKLIVNAGRIEILTTGGKYVYTSDLTSSPKGIRADGDIEINGGTINISVTGNNDGAEGLESKADLTINDGEIFIYAYDDALNAKSSVTINGGKVFCYAINNDGIDSNGTLSISGGLVIASGTTSPEEGLDCDDSNKFVVTGGTIIGTGGTATSPSSSSTQRVLLYNGFQAVSGNKFSILDGDGTPVLVYDLPRSMNSMSLFFSSPDLVDGTYTVVSGGSLTGYSDYWNGWYSGGSFTGGTTLGTFTSGSTITTVGGSSSSGGGTGPGSGTPGTNPGRR